MKAFQFKGEATQAEFEQKIYKKGKGLSSEFLHTYGSQTDAQDSSHTKILASI